MSGQSPPQTPPIQQSPYTSTVYGPVHSWRVGWSLGIDLLFQSSICSFNCIYCQLGEIQVKTIERKMYVPTEKVEKDLKHSQWQKADIITFSGNGEPTLALNLAEIIHFVKEYTLKPVMVLTNGTTLHLPEVQRDLMEADIVSVKLDAATDKVLQRMNRPVAGVSLEKIVEGAAQFKKTFPGKMALQCMFMPANLEDVEALTGLINTIQPDEVQLNTPKRPYPLEWHVGSRGNHEEDLEIKKTALRTISVEDADRIEKLIQERTHIPVLSIYQPPAP